MNYFYADANNQAIGPATLEQLRALQGKGTITWHTLVILEGTKDWKPFGKMLSEMPPPHSVPQGAPVSNIDVAPPVYTMKGVQDLLEVYADKVAITPKGVMGFLSKGLKGTKTIPFISITAIQFRQAGLINGYLQFTLPGGNESRGGVLDATVDENTFMFGGGKAENERALEIKNYIERRVQAMRSPHSTAPSSVADELQKLAALKAQGILSDVEFQAAKKRLLS